MRLKPHCGKGKSFAKATSFVTFDPGLEQIFKSNRSHWMSVWMKGTLKYKDWDFQRRLKELYVQWDLDA